MSSTASTSGLRQRIEALGQQEGFDALGVTSLTVPVRSAYYESWIESGSHGTMSWLERNNDRRLVPAQFFPEARSVLIFGLNYWQTQVPERSYRIAQYALGKDYHKTLLRKLKRICEALASEFAASSRPCVDTAPVLEKPLAAHTAIGWQAKNTMLVSRTFGNGLFLGEIFTTLEVEPDKPHPQNCGSCTRCLNACPTSAFRGPWQLDASRCLSYLTIEHKGGFPEAFRKALGNRLYGCDECLDVCPWNRFAKSSREMAFTPRIYPELRVMLEWTQEDFDTALAGTAIRRIGLSRWKRNALVVLGNTGTADDVPFLREWIKALPSSAADQEKTGVTPEILTEHAQWAIDHLQKRTAPAV